MSNEEIAHHEVCLDWHQRILEFILGNRKFTLVRLHFARGLGEDAASTRNHILVDKVDPGVNFSSLLETLTEESGMVFGQKSSNWKLVRDSKRSLLCGGFKDGELTGEGLFAQVKLIIFRIGRDDYLLEGLDAH